MTCMRYCSKIGIVHNTIIPSRRKFEDRLRALSIYTVMLIIAAHGRVFGLRWIMVSALELIRFERGCRALTEECIFQSLV